MIEMIRLDDRLIHGQVAVKWSKHLNVDRIIVASDEAAANELQANALKMAAPSSIKAYVLPIENAVNIVNDPRSASMKMLIVTDAPEKIYNFATKIDEKPYINLANYGRIAGSLDERTKITDTLYLNQDESKKLSELAEAGFEVAYQALPEDSKIIIEKLV